jgi:hypothetical protein
MPTRTHRLVVLVTTLVLLAAIPAPALGWCWSRSYYYSYSYYPPYYSAYSVPVVYAPPAYYLVSTPAYVVPATVCPAPVPVVGPAVPAGHLYAQPTAAPPSGTAPAGQSKEPPTAPATPRGPKVSESSSFYSTHPGAAETTVSYRPSAGRVQVGFWNVSAREVVITVGNTSYTLAAGRAVTVTVTRRFIWRLDQGELRAETVPGERETLEIVIRK